MVFVFIYFYFAGRLSSFGEFHARRGSMIHWLRSKVLSFLCGIYGYVLQFKFCMHVLGIHIKFRWI